VYGILVEVTPQRTDQVLEVRLGESIAEPVGEQQQAPAVADEPEQAIQVLAREEAPRVAPPALLFRVVRACGRRDHRQPNVRKAGC
jgi:hypothetical protein